MKLTIYTAVWGPMEDWFLEYCIPSFLSKNNFPSCRDNIKTYYVSIIGDKIKNSSIFKKLCDTVNVVVDEAIIGDINSKVKKIIPTLLNTNEFFLVTGSDLIWGDGSFKNITSVDENRYDLIATAFPRCNLAILDELKNCQLISNDRLVKIAMKYIHDETKNTGSVFINQVSPNTWKVKHLFPNPIFKVNDKVMKHFASEESRNRGIDHCLPTLFFNNKERILYPDSEFLFLVEPTDRSFAHCTDIPFTKESLEKWQKMAGMNSQFWNTYDLIWKGEE